MPETERRLTTKGIAFFGALTVFLGLLIGADDVVRGEAAQLGGVGVYALGGSLFLTAYVFGIGWAWKEPARPSHHRMFLGWERKLGYGIVLVLSAAFFVVVLALSFGLGGIDSLEAIAAFYTSEAVGAFFVFINLAAGRTTLMALLLSLDALAVPKQD